MSGSRITAVRCHARVLPLPSPLRIGPLHVTAREFAVVEVETASGRIGTAIAQSRGAPIDVIVDRLLAPAVVGRDADDVRARWDDMYRSTVAVGRTGLVLRAASLIDVALWDRLGQQAGLPVHRLLGGARDRVPVTYVAGYPRDADDVERVVASAVSAARDGATSVKVARTPDPALTARMLHGLTAALPDDVRLAIDANWVWRDAIEARAEIAAWPVERLAWIEDPFVPERVDQTARFRRESGARVAAGDELADPSLAIRLVEQGAVDVLRVDVLTIGGFSAATQVVGRAAEAGVPVSFHISPETSVHLACGVPGCLDVESFDRDGNPYDPAHELICGGPTFAGGHAAPSAAPGLGFRVRPA